VLHNNQITGYKSLFPTTHTHTHTRTRTHTHIVLPSCWGFSIGVMVFILYKLYILSPKPTHYRKYSAFLHKTNKQKQTLFSMFIN